VEDALAQEREVCPPIAHPFDQFEPIDMSLARYVADHFHNLVFPFKRYQRIWLLNSK